MFIDETEIILKAGHGGAGKVSFYKYPRVGPDGGNGGRGGDLYIQPTSDITALKKFTTTKTIRAEDGEPGGSNRKFGKDGNDTTIPLPIGSIINVVNDKNEVIETSQITETGQPFLFCIGGKGGKGNFEFKSSRNTTPRYAQPGLPGEEKRIQVDLKLIADYGLIGLPNAGKTSLLNTLTSAHSKVVDYPFTTLEPNLGVVNTGKFASHPKILADIPGLIEGASTGKGLGTKFLKHIEKVSTLIHCISSETEDLTKDYLTIRQELNQFSSELSHKPEIILITKTDLVEQSRLRELINQAKNLNPNTFPVNVLEGEKLVQLINYLE